jgi:hypothetical protein
MASSARNRAGFTVYLHGSGALQDEVNFLRFFVVVTLCRPLPPQQWPQQGSVSGQEHCREVQNAPDAGAVLGGKVRLGFNVFRSSWVVRACAD